MKKFLIFLLFLSLDAKIVDKIVAVVGNTPITSYDVETLSKKLNIPKNKALNILIDKKIIENEIKKRGISVEDYEVEDALENIAKRNNLTLFEFKNILAQRGELESFKERVKENLLKQKLFNEIVNSKLKISPDEIKNYYENHKNEFSVFKTIQVTKYEANNPEILKRLFSNPYYNNPQIKVKTEVLSSKELSLDKLFLFKNTKEGEFTPIVNEGLNYVTYYVASKKGKVYLPFSRVKNIIANKLLQEKRNEILKDYFNKIKNSLDIKIYN